MPGFVNSSNGPGFVRMGTANRGGFVDAALDIQVMSNRFRFLGREAAMDALQIMEDNIVKYVDPGSDHDFEYSEGRLAATIGTWKPELIQDSRVQERAEEWADANDVAFDEPESPDGESNYQLIENGAYKAVKRYRGSVWSAEVGTFTPYAHLVEDGGDMQINPYGNQNTTVDAHWEAHNMFSKGLFDSYQMMEDIIQGKVKGIL